LLGHLGKLRNPLGAIVLHIPQQTHISTGAEDAYGFVQELRHLEPVGGLPRYDCIHRGIGEWHGLGDSCSCLGAFDTCAHLGIGFDRHGFAAETNENLGQLARPGTNIDNRTGHPWEYKAHRILWIVWSATHVRVGSASEGLGSI
jgi:hypothetical protein